MIVAAALILALQQAQIPPSLDLALGKPTFSAQPRTISVPVIVRGTKSRPTTIRAVSNGWGSPIVVSVPPLDPGEHPISIPLPANLKPGNYLVALVINQPPELKESTYANNATRLIVDIPQPPLVLDLALGKPTFTAQPPTIVVPVIVSGTKSAPTTLRASSTFAPIVVNVPSLDPGEHPISVSLPENLKPGRYFVSLAINQPATQKESTFNNNATRLIVDIPEVPPPLDLALGQPSFTAQPPTIVVPVIVSGARSAPTTIRVSSSSFPPIAVDVPALDPGEHPISIALPANLQPGSYGVVLTINQPEEQKESTFENNTAKLTIDIAPPPLDLALGQPTFTAQPPTIVVPVIVSGAKSAPTTIRASSSFSIIVDVPPLDPGEHPISVPLPAKLKPGSYPVSLTINTPEGQKESTLDNNTAQLTVDIAEAPPAPVDLALGTPVFIAKPPTIVVPVIVSGGRSAATFIRASSNAWSPPIIVDVPPLDPGDHRLSIPLPGSVKPGRHAVALTINQPATQQESSFANNTAELVADFPAEATSRPWIIVGAALAVLLGIITVRASTRRARAAAAPLPQIVFRPTAVPGTQTITTSQGAWGKFDVSVRAQSGTSSSSVKEES